MSYLILNCDRVIEVFGMTCQDDFMLTYHGNLFVKIRVQVMHTYMNLCCMVAYWFELLCLLFRLKLFIVGFQPDCFYGFLQERQRQEGSV